ncbi:MAG: hypothetical protein IVW54_01655 [Candidatus Binataceae bacterium]|nr:hypothetical protein [Candidatus Binataceae bacterium]
MSINGRGLRIVTAFAAASFWVAGCATATRQVGAPADPIVQTLQYYPYQVKGYQNSYAKRRILVLMPVDAHQPVLAPGLTALPYQGNVAVGAVDDMTNQPVQELYAAPIGGLVQDGIAQSAREAGLIATVTPGSLYVPGQVVGADYVLQSRIVRCWVSRRPGPGGQSGPAWFNSAQFAIEVTVFKPPFSVPFWQGMSAADYYDPPIDSNTIDPEDETAIYDQPSEVLSVALTRAVAGIFNRTALFSLVNEDRMQSHQ